ncbi:MAG: transposase [Paracoccus sp. (in: a-proteobacteria)]|nr:transposase [Paracoccus sp. (in: a-proteobacteria)]
MKTIISDARQPRAGDLVLARVDEISHHTKLELTDGRKALMFPGDEIVVCFGNRYAPDQFEALVPTDMSTCDLVAAGGIAAHELVRHQRMKPPTRITPVGLIGNAEGERVNVLDFRVDAPDHKPEIPAILSLGTSMNAGKTLAATSMVRGFKRAGLKVVALKITGTGAGGDMWIVRDAGADMSYDFTDGGYASTYLTEISDIIGLTYRLMNYAAKHGAQIAVIEIADGLHQLETAQLIRRPEIRDVAVGTLFNSYDAMGAVQGVKELREAGHDILGLSGQLGRAPLGVREAEAASGLRVYLPFELQNGALVPAVRERAAAKLEREGGENKYLRALANAELPPDMPEALGHLARPGASAAMPRWSSKMLERDILSMAAHCVMQSDADALCGVEPGRKGRRCDWRNGSHQMIWETELGPVELKVPRLKIAKYAPPFLTAQEPVLPRLEAVLSADSSSRHLAVQDLLAALSPSPVSPARLWHLTEQAGSRIAAAAEPGRPEHLALVRPVEFRPVENEITAYQPEEMSDDDLIVEELVRARA